jgi:hypothetical protein
MKPFNHILQEGKVEKQKFIEVMSAAHSASKHSYNLLTDGRYRLEILAALESLGVPKNVASDIYDQAKTDHVSNDRTGIMTFVPIFRVYDIMRARRLVESHQFKIGDKVHMGSNTVGGAGYDGVIEKIEGDAVFIKNKWHGKTQKGHVKNLRKL